ncbi:transglycosylase SLT domain-containing protein [Pleomorphomonas koreensis]|uniref:transglycosylase SLT domain-containing protein n=1 Tax=Pleomorphomonas koreensis TaxID=257440 RepID=UPI000411B229|nr:transglycosylase SLT domain-containing protein [Pleomorphomonas koreensis]
MARMREPAGYQPFRLNPILPEGRVGQPAFGGDLWYRTADALAKAAGVFGQRAKEKQAQAQDQRDLQEALASSEGSTTISGGPVPDIGAGDLGTAIDAAAGKYGEDAKTMRGIAFIESRGDVKAYNKGSKAAGPFQFVPGTARDYGLANPYDPAQASDAAARLLRDNRAYLKKSLGRDPTPGELYLAHQQGAGGAEELLKNPDKLAVNVVPLSHILSNGGTADMTAGQFAKLWIDKMGGAPGVTRSAPGVRSSNPDTPFGRHAVDYWQRIQVSIDKDVGEIETRFADDPAGMTQALTDLRKAYQPQIFPELQADFDATWQRSTAPAIAQAGKRAEAKLTANQQATFLGNIQSSEEQRDRAVEGAVPGSTAGLADLTRRQGEIDAQYDEAAKRGYITPLQAIDQKTASRRATVGRFYERQGEALTTPEDVAALRKKYHEDFAAGKLDGIDQQGWESLDARMGAIEAKKRTEGNVADAALKTRADDLAARVAAGGEASPAEINKLTTDAGTAPNGEAIVRGATAKIEVAKILRDLPVDQAEAKLQEMSDQVSTDRYMAAPSPEGLVQPGNIDLTARPHVQNADGSVSTVRSMSFGEDGVEVLVPTVSDDGRLLTDDEAIDEYHRTGRFLGKFKDADSATAYAEALHQQQASGDAPGRAPTAEELEAIQFGKQQVLKTRTMLAKDPLGLAVERGLVGDVPALDLSGGVEAAALAGDVAQRVVTARAISEHYGIAPRYLRPGEAKELAGLLKSDPDAVASALTGIVGGSASAAPDILGEISESSQPIADAGRLLLAGGSGDTALDLLRGASKSPDGKEWKSIKPEVQAPWAAQTIGNAYEAMPEDMRRLKSSAALIARYRLAEAGILPDDPGAEDIYKQALNEAAGATIVGAHQYGGIADLDRPGYWSGSDQVIVPSDVDASRFGDLLDAIRDRDLPSRPATDDGTPLNWGEIHGARPVAVAGGYVFVLGDQTGGNGRMFRNADGTPWVLDLDSLLPTLAKRTVGIVRGY